MGGMEHLYPCCALLCPKWNVELRVVIAGIALNQIAILGSSGLGPSDLPRYYLRATAVATS